MSDRESDEVQLTKGVTDKRQKAVKKAGLSRDKNQKVVGKGHSEGSVYGGVKVRMGDRELPMVEKVFDSSLLQKFPEITPEKIIENHSRLKKMGFPVTNTMRIIETASGKPKRMLMTDLTEGGKKSIYTSSSFYDEINNFSLNNPDEVNNQLLEIYKLCLGNGVEIDHEDVFFLVVDNNSGRGEIVLGDISRIKIHDDPKEKRTFQDVEAYGYQKMQTFIDLINKRIDSGKLDFDPIRKYDQTLVST